MKNTLTCLLLITLLTVACDKKKAPVPEPETPVAVTPVTPEPKPEPEPEPERPTGSLSGIILPAGVVESVAVKAAAGGKIYTVIPDKLPGAFAMEKLPEGDYTFVAFSDPYNENTATPIMSIKAGTNTDAGTIATKERSFRLSCLVNGKLEVWPWKAFYGSSRLFQLTNYGCCTTPEDRKLRYTLHLSIRNLTGPGTYVCNAESGAEIIYRATKGSMTVSQQSTGNAGSSGEIVITEIDPVARMIKGNFKATMSAGNTTTTALEITKGRINALY